jgi:hypothetical protein
MQLGHSHHQLATLRAGLVNVLVDGALVAALRTSEFRGLGVLHAHQGDRMTGVRRITQQIKDGRLIRGLRLETNIGIPASDVEDVGLASS